MGAEPALYSPQLPAGPAGLTYDDLVAAWHEVESRSAWFKARLAAAVAKGDLRRYAADVGVSYATVKHYRSVAEKYPAEKIGRPNLSFGAAAALMGLKDRLELVSREEPWTVAEARALAASRRKPAALPSGKTSTETNNTDTKAKTATVSPGVDGYVPGTSTETGTPDDGGSAQEPSVGQETASGSSGVQDQDEAAAEITRDPGDCSGEGQRPARIRAQRRPGARGPRQPWGLLGSASAERARLRAGIRAEVENELRARIRKNWGKLVAENEKLTAERDELKARLSPAGAGRKPHRHRPETDWETGVVRCADPGCRQELDEGVAG
jgi:hypothetical protein